MTKKEVKKKWASTRKLLEITDSEYNGVTQEAANLRFIKTKLQIAVYYLQMLDEHKCEYEVPWNKEQFKWLLRKPVGDKKKQQAKEWCHECRLMRDKVCTTWNYEEAKTA
ncbi:hypothetical protein HQ33_07510 [Limosilactobacillus reuteri]|nr:hypothetical protein HQ33_07510 [Limosilactobacillus reuteri]